MSGNQRAFARKMQDYNSSISSMSSIGSTNQERLSQLTDQPVPTNFFTGRLEDQIVDPADFEKLVLKCPDSLCDFPVDDIEIITTDISLKSSSKIPDLKTSYHDVTDSNAADCIRLFEQPNSYVIRRYAHFSPQFFSGLGKIDRIDNALASLDYETHKISESCGMSRERQPRDCLMENLSSTGEKFDEGLVKMRAHRLNEPQRFPELLSLLVLETPLLKVNRVLSPTKSSSAHIHIQCASASVGLNLEPFFFSMFLYDAQAKKRISENFYFDFISAPVRDLLQKHSLPSAASSEIKDAIFTITHASEDIFVVVRVEKVFQSGDLDSACEPFIKNDRSSKAIDKNKITAKFWCDLLGAYRMPVAWTEFSLTDVVKENQGNLVSKRKSLAVGKALDENLDVSRSGSFSGSECSTFSAISDSSISSIRNSFRKAQATVISKQSKTMDLLKNFSTVDVNLKTFFMQNPEKLTDSDMGEYISGFKNNSSLSRGLKTLDFSLKLQIGPIRQPFPNHFSPDLSIQNPEEAPLMKSVLEFPSNPNLSPFTSYVNLLYLSPKQVNFSRIGFPRSVCLRISVVERKPDRLENLTCIFGKSAEPEFKRSVNCAILYHNKSPSFYEEVKIRLPADLHRNHHLLFEFFHVSCHVKKGVPEGETYMGFTWLPLLDERGILNIGECSLPLSLDKLDADSLSSHPKCSTANIKWLDGRKDIFSIVVSSHSSVHAPDRRIQKFFVAFSRIFLMDVSKIDEKTAGNLDRSLKKSIVELPNAKCEVLLQYMHIIVYRLLLMITSKKTLAGIPLVTGKTAFVSLVSIVDKLHHIDPSLDSFNRSGLLLAFINDRLSFDDGSLETSLHTQLMTHLMDLAGPDKESAMARIWFVFEIIIKSLAHHNEVGALGLRLAELGESRLQPDLWAVVLNVTQCITLKAHVDYKVASYINQYLAFFLSDLFSVCNRYWVLLYIKLYLQHMNNHISFAEDIHSAVALKYDFLRIVCTHEHFVVLNLPFYEDDSPDMSEVFDTRMLRASMISNASNSSLKTDLFIAANISVQFRELHFLVGIVLFEVATVLRSENAALEKQAIGLLLQIAQYAEGDQRFADSSVKSKVVALFFPILELLTTFRDLLAPTADVKKGEMMENTISKIAGIQSAPKNSHRLSVELTRQVLALFLWVVKCSEPSRVKSWLGSLADGTLLKVAEITKKAAVFFDYRGGLALTREPVKHEDAKQKLEGLFMGSSGARNELLNRRKQSTISSNRVTQGSQNSTPTGSLSRATGSRWSVLESENSLCASVDVETRLKFEQNICFECTFVCLDIVDYLVSVARQRSSFNMVIVGGMSCLNAILSSDQPSALLKQTVLLHRLILSEFADLILVQEWDLCSDVCLCLLRLSFSSDPDLRIQATSSLYFILRLGYMMSESRSLARFKIQFVICLSSLVPDLDSAKTNFLERTFKSIVAEASDDVELRETSFATQLKDLALNLHAILLDTMEMNGQNCDSELQLDLMHRVANGYRSCLDLRITWLRNMELFHRERKAFAEAAMCVVHSAAVVAEGLYHLERRDDNPLGATDFEDISINVLEESLLEYDPNDYFLSSQIVSRSKLQELFESAVKYFDKAELWELCILCLSHLLQLFRFSPVLHSDLHSRIVEFHDKIVEKESTGKRWFPQFFRVGFYGAKLDNLDGQEFIYKEPPYTQLSVISAKLEQSFIQRYGPGNVEIVKNSDQIDRSKLSADKVYIQVTFVEPWLDSYQEAERTSLFSRNLGLNQFVFNVPFTKSGKAHATDLKDQWKRRVILQTAETFPYLKTRLEVVDTCVQVLSPVEVAFEDLWKKVEQFEKCLATENVDYKRLQLILQGCIGTQVNQGPTEIALVFLDNLAEGEWSVKQDALRLLFKRFLALCKRGLSVNKALIKEDQIQYQAQLERDFIKMKANVDHLLVNPNRFDFSPSTPTNERESITAF